MIGDSLQVSFAWYFVSSFLGLLIAPGRQARLLYQCKSANPARFGSILSEIKAQVILTTSSLVENNVAIIVGSMPAFASFLRIYVSGSSFFKTLRSKLTPGSSKGESALDSNDLPLPPKLGTFGSSHPKKAPYHELSEPGYLESQITATGNTANGGNLGNNGVYRSFQLVQTGQSHYSSERLV